MTFLPTTTYDELSPLAQSVSARHVESYGGAITNTKAALLGHLPSFEALMEWYTIRDELAPFIGERAVTLLAYAISDENDSLVCAVHFRRVLIDSGEDVDDPQVTESESLLIEWGRAVAKNPHGIGDDMVGRLEDAFHPKLRLILSTFAALTVATNVFNTVGRIPLDERSYAYRKAGDTRTRG